MSKHSVFRSPSKFKILLINTKDDLQHFLTPETHFFILTVQRSQSVLMKYLIKTLCYIPLSTLQMDTCSKLMLVFFLILLTLDSLPYCSYLKNVTKTQCSLFFHHVSLFLFHFNFFLQILLLCYRHCKFSLYHFKTLSLRFTQSFIYCT